MRILAQEIMLAICALAMMVLDLRKSLEPLPFAADASNKGCGACRAVKLSSCGTREAHQIAKAPSNEPVAGIIMVDLFGGMAGGALACELSGISVLLLFAITDSQAFRRSQSCF